MTVDSDKRGKENKYKNELREKIRDRDQIVEIQVIDDVLPVFGGIKRSISVEGARGRVSIISWDFAPFEPFLEDFVTGGEKVGEKLKRGVLIEINTIFLTSLYEE